MSLPTIGATAQSTNSSDSASRLPGPRVPGTQPNSSPSAETPSISSLRPSVPSTPRDLVYRDRYSDQEWGQLVSTPWSDLPVELQEKTRKYQDDPISQQANRDSPFPYLT